MFGLDAKQQEDAIPAPEDQPSDIIISPDTRRSNRVPSGQSRTKKWPVLDASGTPRIDLAKWRFQMVGLIGKEISFSWAEFLELPRVKVFSDFHCVTRWSRLGNVWEGVPTRKLVELAGGVKSECKFVTAHGYDYGWTTNLPLSDFLSEDALVALTHDGEPLADEHGGPARLIVPQLYSWKSAKWIAGVEFMENDKPGFWERNGYHMHGDPWKEERFGY
jgi:DMSO/TMAO reductase YedYZ molybdopterin-dependent catalytic subunit